MAYAMCLYFNSVFSTSYKWLKNFFTFFTKKVDKI